MAAVDYFLKVDGIDGESASDKHKNEIDIESWAFGVTQSGTMAYGGGGGAGKANFMDFVVTAHVGKHTPKLMAACAGGEHIKEAKMTCQKAGKEQQEYFTIKLNDCIISSYQAGGVEARQGSTPTLGSPRAGGQAGATPGLVGGGDTEVVPTDSFSFNYAKVEIEYKEQKPDGSLGGTTKAGWDVKKNVKV